MSESGAFPDIGDERVYDMIVVGAGPADLAASVYGGFEGLDVVVLDATAPGSFESNKGGI
jgi:thioredoxin reductase (NADPH)